MHMQSMNRVPPHVDTHDEYCSIVPSAGIANINNINDTMNVPTKKHNYCMIRTKLRYKNAIFSILNSNLKWQYLDFTAH